MKNASHSDSQKIKRFIKLDQLFRNTEGYTIKEIAAMDEFADLQSDRTLKMYHSEFQQYFGAVFDEEAYRGREKLWRYKDPNFSIFKQINKDVEILNKYVQELELFKGDPRYDLIRFSLLELRNGINESKPVMSFDYNPDLVGLEHIEELAHSIIHKYPVKITYKPYNKDAFTVNVHPYHLRQYNNRWILFGWSEKGNAIHNYPIDRIISVEHLSKEFIPTEVDFDEYFDEIVGVTNYEQSPVEDILLRVAKSSFNYIQTKPLHWTQTKIKEKETEDSVFVRLKVKVNRELKMLLFSYMDAIEVLEPLSLREEMSELISKMHAMYEV